MLPRFEADNYQTWAYRVECTIKAHSLLCWTTIEEGPTPPASLKEERVKDAADVADAKCIEAEFNREWKQAEATARHLLAESLYDTPYMLLILPEARCDAKQLWDKLKEVYGKTSSVAFGKREEDLVAHCMAGCSPKTIGSYLDQFQYLRAEITLRGPPLSATLLYRLLIRGLNGLLEGLNVHFDTNFEARLASITDDDIGKRDLVIDEMVDMIRQSATIYKYNQGVRGTLTR